MPLALLACLLCAVTLFPALAQPRAGWQAAPFGAMPPSMPPQPDRYGPGGVLPQLDVTPLLLQPPPPVAEPPPPPRRPLFSQGWVRDGFGTQAGGWR